MEYNTVKVINDNLDRNTKAIKKQFKPVTIMSHIDSLIDEDWFIETLLRATLRKERKTVKKTPNIEQS